MKSDQELMAVWARAYEAATPGGEPTLMGMHPGYLEKASKAAHRAVYELDRGWIPLTERQPPHGETVVGRDDEGARWLIMREDGAAPGVFNLMEMGPSQNLTIVAWYPLPEGE